MLTRALYSISSCQQNETASRVAQWKRAGPITQRSEDRNLALLIFLRRFKRHALHSFANNDDNHAKAHYVNIPSLNQVRSQELKRAGEGWTSCATRPVILNCHNHEGDSANAVPIRKNYALESSTFGMIAGVSQTEVQWKGLALGRRPY